MSDTNYLVCECVLHLNVLLITPVLTYLGCEWLLGFTSFHSGNITNNWLSSL